MSKQEFPLDSFTYFKFLSSHEYNFNQLDDNKHIENNSKIMQQGEVISDGCLIDLNLFNCILYGLVQSVNTILHICVCQLMIYKQQIVRIDQIIFQNYSYLKCLNLSQSSQVLNQTYFNLYQQNQTTFLVLQKPSQTIISLLTRRYLMIYIFGTEITIFFLLTLCIQQSYMNKALNQLDLNIILTKFIFDIVRLYAQIKGNVHEPELLNIILTDIIINILMIQKIKAVLNNPLQAAFMFSGIGLLGFYYFYVRKQYDSHVKISSNNALNLTLKQLVKNQDRQNVCKIVITQSSPISSEFKGRLITRLKQFLIDQKLQCLVNCAPLKIFKAGAETFVSTLTQDDAQDQKDLMVYFNNALRCQLIVQKTIVDIQKIRKNSVKTYIICDTNSLDIKDNSNLKIWEKFLQLQNINESDLKKNYDVIFHIKGTQNLVIQRQMLEKGYSDYYAIKQDFDQKTTKTWRNSPNYHVLYYDSFLMLEQNIQIALEHIIDCLRIFFQKDLVYRKRMVFAKQW